MNVVAPIREIPSYPIDENPKEIECSIICGNCGEKIDTYKSFPTWYTKVFREPKICKKCGYVNDYRFMK